MDKEGTWLVHAAPDPSSGVQGQRETAAKYTSLGEENGREKYAPIQRENRTVFVT